MASPEVVAALNALSEAVRDAVRAAGSGQTPPSVTVMQPITVASPVYANKGSCIGVRFTLPAVMNPRDLIAISGTVTYRSTLGYTKTTGGSTSYVTLDTVVMMSDVTAVDFSGTTATVASTLAAIPNPAIPALTVVVSTTWSVVAFTPTSAVRYVGT